MEVFSQETALENVLLRNDKVITTPHLAASTVEAEACVSVDIVEHVMAVLKGRPALSGAMMALSLDEPFTEACYQ
jgi:D-3-phosphoglycerate dehydrogenase